MEFIKQNVKIKNFLLPLIAVLIYLLTPFLQLSNTYLDSNLKEAASTYASLKIMNGVVAVLQHSSVSEGVVINMTQTPGEILEPLHDTIERFADMMTLSLVAIGSQKILWEFSHLPMLLYLVALLGVIYIFYPKESVKKFLVMMIVFKLFIPFSALVSNYTNEHIFFPKIQTSKAILQNSIEGISTNSSMLEKIKNFSAQMGYYLSHKDEIGDALVELITLYFSQFLINILLIPLFFIYGVKNFLKS